MSQKIQASLSTPEAMIKTSSNASPNSSLLCKQLFQNLTTGGGTDATNPISNLINKSCYKYFAFNSTNVKTTTNVSEKNMFNHQPTPATSEMAATTTTATTTASHWPSSFGNNHNECSSLRKNEPSFGGYSSGHHLLGLNGPSAGSSMDARVNYKENYLQQSDVAVSNKSTSFLGNVNYQPTGNSHSCHHYYSSPTQDTSVCGEANHCVQTYLPDSSFESSCSSSSSSLSTSSSSYWNQSQANSCSSSRQYQQQQQQQQQQSQHTMAGYMSAEQPVVKGGGGVYRSSYDVNQSYFANKNSVSNNEMREFYSYGADHMSSAAAAAAASLGDPDLFLDNFFNSMDTYQNKVY
jgi:hypothetical protein